MGGGTTVNLCRQFAGRRRHLPCGVYLTQLAKTCGESGGGGCAELCAMIWEKSPSWSLRALDIRDSDELRLLDSVSPVCGLFAK